MGSEPHADLLAGGIAPEALVAQDDGTVVVPVPDDASHGLVYRPAESLAQGRLRGEFHYILLVAVHRVSDRGSKDAWPIDLTLALYIRECDRHIHGLLWILSFSHPLNQY